LDFGNVKAPNATSGFCEVRVAPSLYVCVVFCRSLFVLSSVFFWPLYCLSFHPFCFGHCIVCPFILFVLAILLFVLSSFFFWPLYCLSFVDLQLLITPLVSSNFFKCSGKSFNTPKQAWSFGQRNHCPFNHIWIFFSQ